MKFFTGHPAIKSGSAHYLWKGGLDNYVPEPNSGCWLWLGMVDECGYARVQYHGRLRGAHRAMYERERGPVPAGLVLDHLCRVRSCVNPAHMEPVTNGENLRRGNWPWNSRRTACRRHGHAFDERNTRITPEGHRSCRACARDHARRAFNEKKWRNR